MNDVVASSYLTSEPGEIALKIGSGLRKCENTLIQLGHVPFAASHTGIDLSNMPTEGGRISMQIGGLHSRSSIDWPSLSQFRNRVPDTHFN